MVVLFVATSMASACSGDDGGEATPAPTIVVDVPDVVDEVCDDPVGDLGTSAREEGNLSEPAGVDLVRGEVHLTSTSLVLAIETNGDIATSPDPTLTVFQGPPGMLSSWELRMAPVDGVWATTLITYHPGEGEIIIDEARRPLPTTPTVEGTSMRLEIPREMVPPPLTLAWVFGTSSTVATEWPDGGVVDDTEVTSERTTSTETTFDECDTLFTGAAGSPGTTEP